MRKEQKSVRRTVSACQTCGANSACDCQIMLTKTIFDEGAFFQPFIFHASQFLDIRSWIALAAANKKLRSAYYQIAQPIVRAPSHFALSDSIQPKYYNELAFHQNPVVEFVTRNFILKLSHGKLSFQRLSQQNFNTENPVAFVPIDVKNFVTGLSPAFVLSDDQPPYVKQVYLWQEKMLYLYEINKSITEKCQIATTAAIQKVIPAPDKKALVITDEAINNVYILDISATPTLTQQTFNIRCKDVMVLNSVNDLLILSNQGTIYALGDVRHNYHSPHLPVANYATLTPVFTAITDKIIGFDKGEDYLVAWTEKQMTVIGRGKDQVGSVGPAHYSEIAMPHIVGKIVQIKAGDHHLLALTDEGEVYSAGFNYSDQLARERSSGFFGIRYDHKMKKVSSLPNTVVAIYTGFDGQSAFVDHEGKTFLRGSIKLAPRIAPENDAWRGLVPA